MLQILHDCDFASIPPEPLRCTVTGRLVLGLDGMSKSSPAVTTADTQTTPPRLEIAFTRNLAVAPWSLGCARPESKVHIFQQTPKRVDVRRF